jgi:hypothetical protein
LSKSDLIDVAVRLHHETEKAWLVSDDGEVESAVWIPKSQAEIEAKANGRMHMLTLPEWLATDKRLI